jgi:hypothetical protein
MMDVETVTRTIQLILAPVVMVSACALILVGLLNRYSAIANRLRSMARERLDLGAMQNQSQDQPHLAAERLNQIDTQMPLLLRHHKLVRDAVLCVYCAVAFYIADMFVIALAAATGIVWLSTAVLLLFLVAVGLLFAAVLLMAGEIRTSHQALEYEVQHVAVLGSTQE